MKKIGLLLSGCGNRDGSEIHEASLSLLAIDLNGGKAVCIAPSGGKRVVRNHITGEDTTERRDVLLESARIARGNIKEIKSVSSGDFDALIIPGGQGAGQNLSTYLFDGVDCELNPDVERLIKQMIKDKKPIGAICIAPLILAKALSNVGISATMTIGVDKKVAKDLQKLGMIHKECPATDCIIDREKKIVTTSAYMNARSISEVWQGINKLVQSIISIC